MKWIQGAVLTLLCCFLSLPVHAAALPRLVDQADLLSAEEETALLDNLNEISLRHNCDVVVVTVPSLNGKDVTAYADDFYDANGYGMGADQSGILFLIAMDEREWAISTAGSAISVFTDSGLDWMEDAFLPDLSNGYYHAAFSTYAQMCDDYLTQAESGPVFDVGTPSQKGVSPLSPVSSLAVIAAGILVGFLITNYMKRQLKSVTPQRAAASYIRSGTPQILEQRDQFLYHTISRTPRPKSSSSGGSSTHRSSSGVRHGGSRGRF